MANQDRHCRYFFIDAEISPLSSLTMLSQQSQRRTPITSIDSANVACCCVFTTCCRPTTPSRASSGCVERVKTMPAGIRNQAVSSCDLCSNVRCAKLDSFPKSTHTLGCWIVTTILQRSRGRTACQHSSFHSFLIDVFFFPIVRLKWRMWHCEVSSTASHYVGRASGMN